MPLEFHEPKDPHTYAMIKDGEVENVFVVDYEEPTWESSLQTLVNSYGFTAYILLDGMDPQPATGWSCDTTTTPPTFSSTPILSRAITNQQTALDAWLAQTLATPLVINGISLPVDQDSQTRLTSLVVSDQGAVAAGFMQLTDTTGLVDSNGIWQAMTVQQLLATMFAYSTACKQVVQTYAQASAAIQGGTSVSEVLAVTW